MMLVIGAIAALVAVVILVRGGMRPLTDLEDLGTFLILAPLLWGALFIGGAFLFAVVTGDFPGM